MPNLSNCTLCCCVILYHLPLVQKVKPHNLYNCHSRICRLLPDLASSLSRWISLASPTPLKGHLFRIPDRWGKPPLDSPHFSTSTWKEDLKQVAAFQSHAEVHNKFLQSAGHTFLIYTVAHYALFLIHNGSALLAHIQAALQKNPWCPCGKAAENESVVYTCSKESQPAFGLYLKSLANSQQKWLFALSSSWDTTCSVSIFGLTPVQERYWPVCSLQYECHQGSQGPEPQDVQGETKGVGFGQYGERRLWRDTIATYNNVLGGCRQDRVIPLRGAERTTGNKYKLEHGKFKLNIMKNSQYEGR